MASMFQKVANVLSPLETQDLVSPIVSMSQGGIYVSVGQQYTTVVLYCVIH